jgi:DNA-binding response OmpR family regulator
MHTADQAILIIESDSPTRELYTRELNRDYRVFACSDQHEALELLDSHAIDAIVVEPSRPNGQGWAFLAALHAAEVAQSVPVVVCSTLDERTRGVELGVSAYLIKPVLPRTLAETLHRLLGGQSQI